MEENFELIVSHDVLYKNRKVDDDWIKWCWQNVGEYNFTWTVEINGQTDRESAYYVYHIKFRREEDKILFILNWL